VVWMKKSNCSDIFFSLKRPDNEIVLLENIPIKTSRFSLVNNNNKNEICLVGGENNLSTLCYNIETNKWDEFGNLNFYREDPTLFFISNNLYCFGGIVERRHGKSVPKNAIIEFRREHSNKWELLTLNVGSEEINKYAFLSGIGVIPLTEKKILLCGGYTFIDKKTKESKLVYEVSLTEFENKVCDFSLSLNENSISLPFEGWFAENSFFKNNDNFFNFDIDGILFELDTKENKFYEIQEGFKKI